MSETHNVYRKLFTSTFEISCGPPTIIVAAWAAMSMEIDSPQLSRPKKHKNVNGKDIEKKDKKRKRQRSEDREPASRPRKQRSIGRSTSPGAHADDRGHLESPTSSFYKQTSSLYLALPPISQEYALYGLCAEHLSPLILTYYPPFHGVIMSYSNARLSSEPDSESRPAYARAIDEYAASFIWLTADFIVFKPQKGDVIEGWINLQNESNIGLLCLNFFNATIEKRRLPKGWKWMSGGMKPFRKRNMNKAAESADKSVAEDQEVPNGAEEDIVEDAQGYFQDERGKKVEGLIRFKVKDLETSRSIDRETGFLNIEGTMLGKEEEKDFHELEEIRVRENGRKQPKHVMAGALMNGYDGSTDVDQISDITPNPKHRGNY